MSILDNQNINPYLLNAKAYQLAVKNSNRGTSIKMSLYTNYYHTNSLPKTNTILEDILPQVLKTQCFNELNLPFDSEVRNTEIGHLFEHILLEYLCQEKIANGYKRASFRGVTKWNWRKDAKGTFNIVIKVNPSDIIFFQYALEKSIKLLDKILEAN